MADNYLKIITDYFNKYQDYRFLPELMFLYNELTPRFRISQDINKRWFIE